MATILSSVMVLALGVGLLPASASAAQASAPTLQNAAPSVTRLLGFDSNRAFVRVGGQLTDTVSVSPKGSRTVYVQYRRAGTTRFTTAYKAKTSAQGSFNAFLMPRSAGTWQFRLVVVATTQAKNVVSPLRTVTASGRAVPTKIMGFWTTSSTITVGDTLRDAISVSPRASRLIEVQVRRAGTSTWMKTSASGRSTTAGNFLAVYRPSVGVWQYRLVVKASTKARTAVSATRTITAKRVVVTPRDTTAPGPVTGLTATAALNSIALAWTNPTAADFSGVTIRRLAGTTAPTFTTGTVVAETVKAVTSFTDTGLATGTQYSYALFANDSSGNHAAAVNVLRETTGTGPVTDVTTREGNASGDAITLYWTNPTNANFTGVMIRRADGAIAPATPTSGTEVIDLINDPVSYFTDSVGLNPGKQYSYALFAHDAANNYAAGVNVTVTTVVGAAPVAALSINRNGGAATTQLTQGVSYDFDAFSSSAAHAKTLSSATVDYGDGTVGTFLGDPSFWSLSHTYSVAGPKTVTLTVTDSANVTGTAVVTVNVVDALTSAITVDGIPDRVQVNVGASVLFDLASSPAATSYVLNVIGDGTEVNHAAAGAAPESQAIVFDTAGTYLVLFSVANDAGQSSVVDQMEVTVVGALTTPVLSIFGGSSEPTTTGAVGEPMFIWAGDSIAGTDVASAVLTFGDGTSEVFDADPNNWSVDHSYDVAGPYTVTLTIKDAAGATIAEVTELVTIS